MRRRTDPESRKNRLDCLFRLLGTLLFALGALLFAGLLGCAATPRQGLGGPTPAIGQAAPVIVGPVIRRSSDRMLDAIPSIRAAALLPTDARYRVTLGDDGVLNVAVVAQASGIDWIVESLSISAGTRRRGDTVGVRVRHVQLDRRVTSDVDASAFDAALAGEARVAGHTSRWRVRLERDGTLGGERWSLARRRQPETPASLLTLRRMWAITTDLETLVGPLANDAFDRCELAERIALAELAVDLGVRAWTGRGRARLPSLVSFAPSGRVCPR